MPSILWPTRPPDATYSLSCTRRTWDVMLTRRAYAPAEFGPSPSRYAARMAESEKDRDITSPDDPTHEATTPPGNGEADEKAVEESEDKLDQAGGGH